MRRTAVLVAGWFSAGVLAVTLASASVAIVGNQVTGSRPSPLNAEEVRRELASGTTATTAVPGATTATSSPPSDPITPTTAPPPAATTNPPGGTTSTSAAPTDPPPVLRTYPVAGGVVTVRFTQTGATVESAAPNPGFAVEIEPAHGNGVRVEFESESHRSRVEAWWDAGPQDRVDESE